MPNGRYGNDKIMELLVELGGRANLDEIVALAKTKQSPLDKTQIWDRLISLSRKGLVRKEPDMWVMISAET